MDFFRLQSPDELQTLGHTKQLNFEFSDLFSSTIEWLRNKVVTDASPRNVDM